MFGLFSFFVDDEQMYISKIWAHFRLVVWEMDTGRISGEGNTPFSFIFDIGR